MTGLLPGWAITTIGEIADTSLGKMIDHGKEFNGHETPCLRNVNVRWGRIDLDDVLAADISPEERELYRLESGDLLICEGGEIGRCAIWQGHSRYMAYQKTLHRVRPHNGVDVRYLRYFIEHMSISGDIDQYSTGGAIRHLPQRQLRCLRIQLPPTAEQRRIVAVLEDHISRLDTADVAMARVSRRLKLLTKRILVEAVPISGPEHWTLVSVADAGKVELGRARHPEWHTGPHMHPYLRVANIFEDRIDASSIMEMNFPPDVFKRYRLIEKDILLNEGQSVEYLGRPAMYRGIPEGVAFTNSLLRFRAGPDVLPEWALLVFRRHMHARRFYREARITTNIAHLSLARLKKVEFPIPPLEEQERIVAEVQEILDSVKRLADAAEAGTKRAERLRKSLLAQAFAGRLVERDPADEPASLLLERIRAERAVRRPVRRARREGRTVQKETLF